jgi:SAM-dependent methyltransferase
MSLSPSELLRLKYPFGGAPGRDQARLMFDFSVGISAFKEIPGNTKVLDFACGTGWTSEWLNRFGYDVHAFDVDPSVIQLANRRPELDKRIDPERFHTSVGDGHSVGFPGETFGHVFCFDSLHHMRDYRVVLQELHRVLIPGGRAVFIEPGSRHSSSPETIKFLKERNFGAWWIEKDVELGEISNLGRTVGFAGLWVKPFLVPSMGCTTFSFADWHNILDNRDGVANYMRELRRFNYEDRVVFYLEKPASP